MMIYKITPSVHIIYWLKHLDTHLSEQTNQNWIKAPKVVKPKNKKTKITYVLDFNIIYVLFIGFVQLKLKGELASFLKA